MLSLKIGLENFCQNMRKCLSFSYGRLKKTKKVFYQELEGEHWTTFCESCEQLHGLIEDMIDF